MYQIFTDFKEVMFLSISFPLSAELLRKLQINFHKIAVCGTY